MPTDTPPAATPNPGSREAIAAGCTCPVLDNSHGKGAYGGSILKEEGTPDFWINYECPIHGTKAMVKDGK